MTQHFLLSAASKTLKLKDIYKAGEEAAGVNGKDTTSEALNAIARLSQLIPAMNKAAMNIGFVSTHLRPPLHEYVNRVGLALFP